MSDYIYAQLHIPKTAGYTFRYHIQKNINNDEQLLLDYGPLGLDVYNPPLDLNIYRSQCWKYLSSLSNVKKNKIKIVHGHIVPYGIHEFFKKPVRYFTFVRNPLERTVSVYNYLSNLYEKEGREKEKSSYFNKTLLINKKIPNFYTWVEEKYDNKELKGHLTMCGHLKFNGYLKGSVLDESAIEEALNKFYFIGLTDNFSEEILYIYNKLKIHKYFIDQNISNKTFNYKNEFLDKEKILSKNIRDSYVYKYGSLLNKNFINRNKSFRKDISKKSLERNIIMPFSQVLFAPRQSIKRAFKFIVGEKRLFIR
jgi:hypothetical protein